MKLKILVIEDDEVFNTLIVRRLNSLDFDAEGSTSAEGALSLILKNNYQMLVIDYKLPEYTAKELIQTLIKKNINVPFIIMTGYADISLSVEMMKLGAWDYIVKDANFIDLLPTVLEKCFTKLKTENLLHETEDSLQKTNEFLESIIESSPLAIIAFDNDLKITSWSPSAEKMFGCSSKDAQGMQIHMFCPGGDCCDCISNLKMVLKGNKVTSVDSIFIRGEGTSFNCSLSSAPLKNSSGAIVGGMSIVEDITDRKKTEAALKKSEERYRLLAENASDVIWTTDIDLNLNYISSSVEKFLGFSVLEMKQKNIQQWFEQKNSMKPIKIFKNLLSHDDPDNNLNGSYYFEAKYLKKDGSSVWGEITVNKLFDLDGKLIGLIGVTRNISQRKDLEEEKQKIQKQFFQSQKLEAIGILAGGVAHDFNNLLTTIQGNVDLAIMKIDPSDPIYDRLNQIHEPVTKASELTRQLLIFGRKQSMEKKMLNINKVIENILKMLTRLIGADVHIDYNLSNEIWTVCADTGNLEQVIMNLALNARDAMIGGGTLSIKTENLNLNEEECSALEKLKPGKYVCLSVIDTGIGMDKEIMEHVFEPFFTTKAPGSGTGLGLSVVYGVVKHHDGCIKVSSEKGNGTCFKLYLPAVPVAPDLIISDEKSCDDLIGNGEKILLVEDDKSVLNFFEKVLIENGYNVLCASTAKHAKKIAEQENYNIDIVFADVVLPDLNGLDLVDGILKENDQIKVILASGYPDAQGKKEEIKQKNYVFLQKPYTVYQLLKNIKTMLLKS